MNRWVLTQWFLLAILVFPTVHFCSIHKRSRFHSAYAIMALSCFVWAFGQHAINTIFFYLHDEQLYFISLLICYAGMCALGPSCVYLSWCFCGKFKHYTNHKKMGFLFGVSAFFYLSVLTSKWHPLYYKSFSLAGRSYGILFYIFTILSYACFTYTAITIQRFQWNSKNKTSWLYIMCILPPVCANTLDMVFITPIYDFTVVSCLLVHIFCYIQIYLYHPINLMPVAEKRVFDDMRSPVIIEDAAGAVLYKNTQAAGFPESLVWPENGESIEFGGGIYTDSQKNYQGIIIHTLTDISEFEQALRQLNAKNTAMYDIQRKLTEQTETLNQKVGTIQRIAAEKRRVEIMTSLSSEVEDMLYQLRDDTKASIERPDREKITANIELCDQTLNAVRRIITEYKGNMEI